GCAARLRRTAVVPGTVLRTPARDRARPSRTARRRRASAEARTGEAARLAGDGPPPAGSADIPNGRRAASAAAGTSSSREDRARPAARQRSIRDDRRARRPGSTSPGTPVPGPRAGRGAAGYRDAAGHRTTDRAAAGLRAEVLLPVLPRSRWRNLQRLPAGPAGERSSMTAV